MFKDTFSGKGE